MDLKEVYNSIALDWAKDAPLHNQWCLDFLNIFSARVGPGGKILDIGCGSGQDDLYLYNLGLKTTGIDFSENLIDEAKKSHPKGNFLVMDMRNLAIPKESFNGVLAKHSLLHLPKKEMTSVLEKIKEILKPKGWLLLTLKEGVGEKEIAEVRYRKPIKRFFAFYTNFEARNLLEGAGFEIIEEGVSRGSSATSLKFLARKV